MLNVGLVGHGDRFDALAAVLKYSETHAIAWAQGDAVVPEGVDSVDLDALGDTPLLFVAVPNRELRPLMAKLGDVMTGRHCVVHLCHGVEPETLKTASDIIEEETPTRRVGFLTGPMRAVDVKAMMPASGVCASHLPEVRSLVEEAVVSDRFRLYQSGDLRGAELAATYGRIIAMASGVAAEMGLGNSVLATLFARGLAEVSRFVESRGADPRTAFGLAGSANLFLDTIAPSVEFQIGATAMQRGKFDAVAVRKEFGPEGRDLVALVETLSDALSGTKLDTHILETCQLMVSGEYAPTDAVVHLMTLPTLSDV